MTGTVVIAILSHRGPDQVKRLVQRVLEGRHTVALVHHDPRGPELALPDSPRVVRVPDARPASWGRMGVVNAQMRSIMHAATTFDDMTWLLLVSGQDYPATHLTVVENELAATEADAFMRHFPVSKNDTDDVHPWQAVTRRRYLRRHRLPWTHRGVPVPRRTPFDQDYGLYVGDLWVNIGRRAIDHLVRQWHVRRDVVDYFATCSVPDEAVLPTLLFNDAPELNVVADHRRFIHWTQGSPHPDVLTVDDVATIVESGAFFARKFDADAPDVMDALDAAADRALQHPRTDHRGTAGNHR